MASDVSLSSTCRWQPMCPNGICRGLENGKTRPSRATLIDLADVLHMPLRDRNALLHAGGFSPEYPDNDWDSSETRPVREAVEFLLRRHEPNPALVLDRRWGLVDANTAAVRLIETFGGRDAMTVAAGNAMRLLVHPDGLRRSIVNFDDVGGHLADRIAREAASYPDDPELAELAEELVELIGPIYRTDPDVALPLVVASHLRTGDTELHLMSMLATVGAALDVTLSELVVELFFPADAVSAATLELLATGGQA